MTKLQQALLLEKAERYEKTDIHVTHPTRLKSKDATNSKERHCGFVSVLLLLTALEFIYTVSRHKHKFC